MSENNIELKNNPEVNNINNNVYALVKLIYGCIFLY